MGSLEVRGNTAGAACTALLAIEHINNDQPLVIMNGDQIIETNLAAALTDFQYRNLDGGIIVFEAVHPRWSYVRCNVEGFVVETAEKRPISKLATAGFYYFARGQDFVNATFEMIKKDDRVGDKFYVCPAYNQMLLKQAKVGIYKIPREAYHSLATPQGVLNYEDHLRTQASQRGFTAINSYSTGAARENIKLSNIFRG
jgi:dTDP-glucose pyrophosphorylase